MSEITITKRQRSYTLFLLVVVFTSSHVDRQIVAILQEPIKQYFQISDTQLGLLTGVMFALFYATLGMPMAMWADRRNRRNLIVAPCLAKDVPLLSPIHIHHLFRG